MSIMINGWMSHDLCLTSQLTQRQKVNSINLQGNIVSFLKSLSLGARSQPGVSIGVERS